MKTLTSKLYLTGICVVLLGLTTAMAIDDEEKKATRAKLGEKVPDFKLNDTNGQERKLSDYKDRIVVLEWIDPKCEFVNNIYRTKAMQNAYKEVKAIDKSVVWIAINSTAGSAAALNNFWIKEYSIKYPILLDQYGVVAKKYNARHSPHMIVIDKDGILRYQGALDDNNLLNKKPGQIKNFVVNAVKQIVDGEAVSPDSTKPYGCAIKQSR